MAELPTFLKIGTTALILKMIEDEYIEDDFSLTEPVRSMRAVSHDVGLGRTLELADGRRMTALEMQWEYYRLAKKYALDNEDSEVVEDVLERWESVLEALETDPMKLADQLDWVAKLKLLRAYRDRDGLDWNHAKMRQIDLQYHDVDRGRSLYWKLVDNGKMERLVTDAEIGWAVDHPPEDTRAYFRGECLRRYSPKIVAASWDALIFDTGDEPLRKVPTMDPTRGTKAHVQDLLDGSTDAGDLIAKLSS
jgi:Pup amidohydrolase